ncbi:MAG: dynamin family protein [Vicinamibacteria bacterium]
MLSHILTAEQEKLLAKERKFLRDLRLALSDLEAEAEELATFESSIQQLDELFLLVVVGEFNAGKSVFINALLGESILKEGVTPTTQRICLLKYGEKVELEENGPIDFITAPVELLREINIVDTPGTNAIQREHEAITRDFVPRSDMVLFVTSADRPYTESERTFLESIRDWGKKIVVVINKIDILESEDERERVVEFVSDNLRSLLKVRPEMFAVSSRQALRRKVGGDAIASQASRFAELERFILATLDEKERVRLKLLNPIGVAGRLIQKYLGLVDDQLGLLTGDLKALEENERQLAIYKEDLERDFRFRLADIENALLDFETRGMDFFEETMRLPRVFDLMNKSKVKSDFERKVVGDLPQVIEQRVNDVIDWMIGAELRQWQAVTDYLESRSTQRSERLLGKFGKFEYDRKRLLDTVARTARQTIASYDQDRESTRLAESVQTAVAGAALLEVGAVGLGTIVTLIASTTLADVTGLFAAGVLSMVGFLVIPARRRFAKRDLHRKVTAIRTQLLDALTGQFDRELEQSLARIRDAITPYTRFVRAEHIRLSDGQNELVRVRDGLNKLKSDVSLV